WLVIHLLLLGAVTNAIVIWSAHFSAAVLRIPAPASRRGEAARLAVLNLGVVAVLAGGATGRSWVGVGGAALVLGAGCAHLAWLGWRAGAGRPGRPASQPRGIPPCWPLWPGSPGYGPGPGGCE